MTRLNMIGRRNLLQGAAGALGASALASPLARAGDDPAPTSGDRDRKLLFVLCATGGASIVDSFLPLARSEVDDEALADTLNAYRDEQLFQPNGSALRCPAYIDNAGMLADVYQSGYPLDAFLGKHFESMTVMAQECSSVNHNVGQARAITGGGIDGGRTIMEAMALRHGEDLVLPNCNMANDGYIQPGADPSVPRWARAEVIASPTGFAAAMDGARSIEGAPDRGLIAHARRVRSDLDDGSVFGQRFARSPQREQFVHNRRVVQPRIEQADLTSQLTLLPPELLDPRYGVTSSPLLPALQGRFPDLLVDPWSAQAALSVLLTYYGLACTTTIGLRHEATYANDKLITTPVAFDFAHTDHRVAQYLMWGHVLKILDGLVDLLKELDYLGDPSLGKMWDRSLIYVATDFGRDKTRPAGAESWGTSHALNNGTLFVSPLLEGNRVFGGLDPKTCRTYGFDGTTGEADPALRNHEGHIYSTIAHALDIEFPERLDMSATVA